MIDRCTDRFGVAVIADIDGHSTKNINDVVVAYPVQLVGCDAGANVFANHAEDIGGKGACLAQHCHIGLRLEDDLFAHHAFSSARVIACGELAACCSASISFWQMSL